MIKFSLGETVIYVGNSIGVPYGTELIIIGFTTAGKYLVKSGDNIIFDYLSDSDLNNKKRFRNKIINKLLK